MKKITYSATSYPFIRFVKKTLKTGLVISFMFTAVEAYAATENSYHVQTPAEMENVITLPSVGMTVETPSIEYMTEIAFQNTIRRMPAAAEMEPVMRFVAKGIGDIQVERVSVDCDTTNRVVNVAYRLPDDILLSISKPLETMDDTFVMFNVYHKRQLLLSETASIELLSQYIHNVEEKIQKLG